MFTEEPLEPIEKNSLLTSRHINKCQEILKRQFPDLGGLHCCTMGVTLDFPKATGDQWLQVVHDNDHWVLVAKTEAGHVSIYDSLAQSCWRKRPHTLSCASSLLQTSEKHLLYKVKSCQQQNNGFDCGVNAVAFATSVAHGVDPITVIYDRRTLRSHLQKLLAAENFTPFPSTKGYPTRGTQSTQSAEEILQKENVYCSCRRTEHRLPPKDWYMVQCESCNELYHRMCHLLCE